MKVQPTIISGACTCGHSWEKHHLSFILNLEYMEELKKIAPDHPPYFPDECLAHGCNEDGGMKFNEETQEWEDHCHRYVDVAAKGEL